MEVIGTVAASTDLIVLSIKASKAAKDVVQSFINAPKELVELKTKLDRLRANIQQVDSLAEGLYSTATVSPSSGSPSITDFLLPPEHKEILSEGLKTSLDALQSIKSLCDARHAVTGGQKLKLRHDVKRRLQWAALDKKKADRLLTEDVKLAEAELDHILAILGVRLANVNQTSLTHLITSQAALHADLRDSVDNIKACVQVEVRTLMEKLPCRDKDSDSTPRPCGRAGTPDNLPGPVSEEAYEAYGTSVSTLDEFDDPGTRLMEHVERRTLVRYSAHFGDYDELVSTRSNHAAVNKLKIGALVAFESKRSRRRIKMTLLFGFKLICDRILKFEIEAQQTCLRWAILGGPKVSSSITLFNMRPRDAPIFHACRAWDLGQVRYLLESGQASLYDVDDLLGGLLEHVVLGKHFTGFEAKARRSKSPSLRRQKLLLEYLLEQGCDPNQFHGEIGPGGRQPAILHACDRGYEDNALTLMSHGADLISFGSILANYFSFNRDQVFSWRFRLLRSIGFSDWKLGTPSRSLLFGASTELAIEEILFALEVVGMDPNLEENLQHTRWEHANAEKSIRAVTMLIEYGAKVNVSQGTWDRSPLSITATIAPRTALFLPDTAHYLLNKGADPLLMGSDGGSAWQTLLLMAYWNTYDGNPVPFSFIDIEGGLTHLLWHNADPFEFFKNKKEWEFKREPQFGAASFSQFLWRNYAKQVRAIQFAQVWSYAPVKKETGLSRGIIVERLGTVLDNAEDGPRFSFEWSGSGMIYPSRRSENQIWSDTEHCARHYRDASPEFFRNATRFYHHISTEEGRRQLSRYPLVRALCDALKHAGYRAEMDDDGDIWYDADGDGDRYFDAREYQPAEDRDDWLVGECPICQDFERYGLGHILREEEEGKRMVREYKEKVREAKRKRFYF